MSRKKLPFMPPTKARLGGTKCLLGCTARKWTQRGPLELPASPLRPNVRRSLPKTPLSGNYRFHRGDMRRFSGKRGLVGGSTCELPLQYGRIIVIFGKGLGTILYSGSAGHGPPFVPRSNRGEAPKKFANLLPIWSKLDSRIAAAKAAMGIFHPKVARPICLSGNSGDDAKAYQEKAVRHAVRESQS